MQLKKKNGILRRIREEAYSFGDHIRDRCEMNIRENHDVCVTNHGGILQTDENTVMFRCSGYRISICGTKLMIDAASNRNALIKGQIAEIRFTPEEHIHA